MDFLQLDESASELDKHISNFGKGVKSSAAKQSTYKRDNKPIHNMKHVETDATHKAVFDHLKKLGYKKTSGYDSKPNEFTIHHNRDEMTSKTDPVHHSSGVSAHVETEHGGKTKVHFTHRNMKEETMTQSFKGFLTSLTELTDKQKKHIDKNNNNKIDGHDFKLLRKEDDMDEGMYSSDVERAFPNGKASGVKTHAPVAPVPDKKYIKGTPENMALKASRKPINGHPTNSMKEAINDNLHPAGAALLKHIKPEHHNKYKAHLTTDTFNGSYKDRTDVLNAAKKAGHLKEEVELEEATVKTQKYEGGKVMTVHHGASHSYPLHPEHQEAIRNLKHGEKTSFKDETGAKVNVHRDVQDVHFTSNKTSTKTTVPHSHFSEELDELSKSTLGSYAKKASRDAVITRKIGADFERKADAARSPGMKAASNEISQKYKEKSWKRRDGLEKAVDRLTKEEIEMHEAFINGREYASHGLMHPDHAKLHKTGDTRDFYASKTGDKISGKVTKNDGKDVHIKDTSGKTHQFKVTPNLPKTTNEAVKRDDIPFDGPYKKTSGDGSVKDKSGAVHGPMSRARDLARKAMQKKMKEEFNIEITEEQAADLCDTVSLHEKMDMAKADMGDVIKDFKKSDAPQFAGKSDEKRREMAIAAKLQADRGGKKTYREFVELIAPQIQEGSADEKVRDVAENAFDLKKSKTPASSGRYDIKQDGNRTIVTRKYNPDTGHSTGTDDDEKPAGEKRGRGRPAGSTSGAKQKGSANKSDYRGIDYKTHSLHLPNSK